MQLHILFAAFILGAPIFIVISEFLGWKGADARYERLAKEVTKVTVILYSMTALTGGLFIFVLLATYGQFTIWLVNHFFAVFAIIYPLLFIGETIVLYANGFGATNSPVQSGSVMQSGTLTPTPTVTIGGVAAKVQFAGLVAPGQFQFNVTVPPGLSNGDQPITATYNGAVIFKLSTRIVCDV